MEREIRGRVDNEQNIFEVVGAGDKNVGVAEIKPQLIRGYG